MSTLPSELSDSATGVWIFQNKGLAVIQSEKAQHFVDKSFKFLFQDKSQVSLYFWITIQGNVEIQITLKSELVVKQIPDIFWGF